MNITTQVVSGRCTQSQWAMLINVFPSLITSTVVSTWTHNDYRFLVYFEEAVTFFFPRNSLNKLWSSATIWHSYSNSVNSLLSCMPSLTLLVTHLLHGNTEMTASLAEPRLKQCSWCCHPTVATFKVRRSYCLLTVCVSFEKRKEEIWDQLSRTLHCQTFDLNASGQLHCCANTQWLV